MSSLYSFAAASILACVFIFGFRLQAKSHHRLWISIAAGVSVSTIFIDLLPEISEGQARFLVERGESLALFPEQAIYIAAMLGFVLFYGLEYMVASSFSEGEEPTAPLFLSIKFAAFAGYSGLIAYLLVHSIWSGRAAFLFYTLAMAFHLLLIDHSLAQGDPVRYKHVGRWLLGAAVIAGWGTGIAMSVPELWLARITGFICGGVIMNTLVVELPEGRGGRFWPFVIAAGTYSAILIAVLK